MFCENMILNVSCTRMDVLTLQKLKNHRVESGFFADFEPFWMSKNDKLDLQILGQIPTES